MTIPTAAPTAPAAASPGRRRPLLLVLIGVLAAAVLVAGLVVAVVRNDRSGAATGSPARAAAGYYAALAGNADRKAFALLCPQRQATGYTSFAASYAADVASGTGIRTWTQTGTPTTRDGVALVPGRLVLADGTATPITVALLRTGHAWQVCTTNLGGIIPGVGSQGGLTTT